MMHTLDKNQKITYEFQVFYFRKVSNIFFLPVIFFVLFLGVVSNLSAAQDVDVDHQSKLLPISFDSPINYETSFLFTAKSKKDWLSEPWAYYEAPKSISDEEFDLFIGELYQVFFDKLSSDDLVEYFKTCVKVNGARFLSNSITRMNNAEKSLTIAKRNEEIKVGRDIYSSIKYWGPSYCLVKFVVRALGELNVPNYVPSQNRLDGVVYAYSSIYIGQFYRAAHAVKNNYFTPMFYKKLGEEISVDENKWRSYYAFKAYKQVGDRFVGVDPYIQEIILFGYMKTADSISGRTKKGYSRTGYCSLPVVSNGIHSISLSSSCLN